MEKGIHSSRVTAIGLGKSRCLAERPGGTRAGADANRRVEVFLVSDGIEFPQRKQLEEGKTVFNYENRVWGQGPGYDDDESDDEMRIGEEVSLQACLCLRR